MAKTRNEQIREMSQLVADFQTVVTRVNHGRATKQPITLSSHECGVLAHMLQILASGQKK